MIIEDQELIAFRTILPDTLSTEAGEVRFGWCSGSWVSSDHRRKGLSMKLLKSAHKDWDGHLMFTNYAPESLQLYQKSNLFNEIHCHKGKRFYLFAKTRELFKKRRFSNSVKPLLYLLDLLIRFLVTLKASLFKLSVNSQYQFKTLTFPDNECYQILEEIGQGRFFKRNKKQFQWIFDYPWVSTTDNRFAKNYPFSSFAHSFSYYTVKVYHKNNMAGFFIFSVREGTLKTLYIITDEKHHNDIARYLIKFSVKMKLKTLTILNARLADCILKTRNPFVFSKNYTQKIYSSFHSKEAVSHYFHDGDGDYTFT